jgi:hypothetical protein
LDNKQHVVGVTDLNSSTNGNLQLLADGKYDRMYYVGPYGEYKTSQSVHDVIIELDAPAEVRMYGLVTSLRPDTPKGWTLYGAASKDGPWTQLDRRDGFPQPVTFYTERAFTVDTPAAYPYYRITFEGRNFVLSEVHLYE